MSMRSETFGLCWSSVLLAFLAAPIAADSLSMAGMILP
jgi:hypothetical protein